MKIKILIITFFIGLIVKAELKAIPSNYEGICPVVVNIEGEIFSLKEEKIQYRFLRSDKLVMPVEVLQIPKRSSKKIKMQWSTSIDLSGWVQVEILFPVHIYSKKINFSVKCLGIEGPPLRPDLTLKFQGPATAKQGENLSNKYKLLVTNTGNREAKNFYVDIILKGWAGNEPAPTREHICGRGFVSLIQSSQDIIPSGLFPSIPPDIPLGSYDLCATVDSTNVIEEIKEDNNQSCSPINILEKDKF